MKQASNPWGQIQHFSNVLSPLHCPPHQWHLTCKNKNKSTKIQNIGHIHDDTTINLPTNKSS